MVDSDGKTSPVKIKEGKVQYTHERRGSISSPSLSWFTKLDGEPNLMSLEKVDRDSSEIWPEKVHGFDTPNLNFSPPPWTKGLTQDDINSMYQLGALSTNGIIAEVKKLYDQSYQLGVQEAKEMTRGKYLNIFTSSRKKI
ncbi:protein lin-52 homolog isoform X2 [Topomyia yanbarensis]|uniref:protein lin-52 homolog isoform X2 n=1 Tax=Topomyia yanbarensis TaxID=2498891 RepID=UPI00273BABAD|nr:protein lin-52 homolog isoform X2 [Topomyia yanbarensis]